MFIPAIHPTPPGTLDAASMGEFVCVCIYIYIYIYVRQQLATIWMYSRQAYVDEKANIGDSFIILCRLEWRC